jgi:hypothetical protein
MTEEMNIHVVAVDDGAAVRFFECPTDGCPSMHKLSKSTSTCDNCEAVVEPDLSVEVIKPPASERREGGGEVDSDPPDPMGGEFEVPDVAAEQSVV